MKLAILLLVAVLAGCGHQASHAAPDAAAASDAPIAHPFTCAGATCDSATQFCYEFQGGAGNIQPTVGCNALPAACLSSHTCVCVMTNTSSACGAARQCSVQGAAVTVICQGI